MAQNFISVFEFLCIYAPPPWFLYLDHKCLCFYSTSCHLANNCSFLDLKWMTIHIVILSTDCHVLSNSHLCICTFSSSSNSSANSRFQMTYYSLSKECFINFCGKMQKNCTYPWGISLVTFCQSESICIILSFCLLLWNILAFEIQVPWFPLKFI